MSVTTTAEENVPGLARLADVANREHGLARRAGRAFIEHAINVGNALHEAKRICPYGEWITWLDANFEGSGYTARTCMRVAAHADQPEVLEADDFTRARRALAGLPRADDGRLRYDDETVEEARRLRAEGVSERAVARQLGISPKTIARWTNPRRLEAIQRRNREQQRLARAAQRALEDQERQREIVRAVKKAGAATQEAWAMAERMQDVLGQAHRETQDREAREALALAGEHYRKMRDEIVRALGVA